MSAQLEKEAAAMAGFVHGFRRQMFHSVPPIPAEVDLKGKTALVTGSNIGLGLECARHFLSLQPALLIMAVRSLSKGEAAAKGYAPIWELDMASFRSVRAFVERCARDIPQDQSGNRRLHAAVLNAGLGAFEFARVGEGRGRETMLQVNYLATALLAILLLPIMKPSPSPSAQSKSASEPGRLTLVGSDSALTATLTDPGKDVGILDYLDRDRPEGARFDGFAQYGDSKLLLTMFVAKLAAEFVSADDVVVNVTNPGPTWGTEIISKNGPLAARLFTGVLFSVLGRSPRDAARTYVHSNQILGKESHGSYTEWLIRAWPPIMYTEEGRRLGDRLWGETMAELSSAKVEETLQEMKRIP
ncbi:hypothetical protein PG990_001091 [Apiospora arundinis]